MMMGKGSGVIGAELPILCLHHLGWAHLCPWCPTRHEINLNEQAGLAASLFLWATFGGQGLNSGEADPLLLKPPATVPVLGV